VQNSAIWESGGKLQANSGDSSMSETSKASLQAVSFEEVLVSCWLTAATAAGKKPAVS